MKWKIFIVIWLFAVMMIHSSLAASNYPQPVGYVNDYAGLLSLSDVQKLEAELRDFDNQTTNEVVVVTVNSLEGLSARSYTIGLANNWKVGKKIKNNGVVFLVAPNEREVDIEVGSGVEQILTQSDVDNILDNEVVPFLKDDKWSEGIFAGANAIVNKLRGGPPIGEKQNPVQNLPPSSPPSSPSNPEDVKAFLLIIASIIGLVIVLLLGNWARGKFKLRKENQQSLLKCQEKISGLETAYPIANKTLEMLIHNNPTSVWQELKQNFDKIGINDIWQEFINIQDKTKKGWILIDEIKNDIKGLDKKINGYSDIIEKINNLPAAIENAKTESMNLIMLLPDKITETQKIVGQEDVFDETKLSFDNTFKRFQVLTERVKGDSAKIDWLNIWVDLQKLSSSLNNIQNNAESNRMTAAKARSEGPKLMEKLPGLIDKLERKLDSDNARQLIAEAKIKYQEASSIHGDSTNWIQTYLTLVAVNDLLDNAERSHRQHIETIRRRSEEAQRSTWKTSSSSYSPGGGGGFGGTGGSRKF